jgi:hypothetical protein
MRSKEDVQLSLWGHGGDSILNANIWEGSGVRKSSVPNTDRKSGRPGTDGEEWLERMSKRSRRQFL